MSEGDGRESYCRDVETYLCRKNGGHLVRIVGPAFEQVTSWATRGIPMRIVFGGIDRYFERYYAKGPRRRPVRIEFCEADVLDLFDEWRRAVGVAATATGENDADDEDVGAIRRRGTLAAHIERVVARLTALRGGEEGPLAPVLTDVVRELDAARAGVKGLRGAARDMLLARLRTLDGELLRMARGSCDATVLRRLEVEADRQLAPFRGRMTEVAYSHSRQASVDRLVREHLRLPTIAFE
jgi:hypothetical protein